MGSGHRLSGADFAAILFALLVCVGVVAVVLDAMGSLDVEFTLADYLVGALETVLMSCAALGLWRRRRWGWWTAVMLALALCVISPIEALFEASPPGSAGTWGIWLLALAALLRLLDRPTTRRAFFAANQQVFPRLQVLYRLASVVGSGLVVNEFMDGFAGFAFAVTLGTLTLWHSARGDDDGIHLTPSGTPAGNARR
jgi:hypothetical protein